MKLVEEFKKQLHELGDIKRVWLTSFNLSIEFVEKHLLPAIVKEEPPRNRLDFESLQLAMADQDVDVQIFADKRMAHRSERKRTTLPVYGISPRQIAGFSDKSLFHPKVIYMESKDGRAILGAGSANLTMSGWARNQEVFTFRKVKTKEQSEQIHGFFRVLRGASGDDKRLQLGANFWGSDSTWAFVHSFQSRSFLDQLFDDRPPPSDLAVWSPYFADDLAAFLATLRTRYDAADLRVHIVPDLLSGTTIRTRWSTALGEELKNGHVHFYLNTVRRDERSELCHAKVWMTATRLAIGSWNCTGPGANILAAGPNGNADNNIEAGFLLRQRTHVDHLLGRPFDIDSRWFASPVQLDEEALNVPEELPFEISVQFDWETQRYVVTIEWVHADQRTFTLKLPDAHPIDILPRAKGARKSSIQHVDIDNPEELLFNHYFIVRAKDEEMYQGVIQETGLAHRRSECYPTLDELLDSLLSENRGGARDGHGGGRTVLRGNDVVDDDEQLPVPEPARARSTSYFKLFQAMQAYAAKICDTKTTAQLEKLVFVLPGCLKEMQEKIRVLGAQSDATVYTWFLIQEFNCMAARARSRYRELTRKQAKGVKWDGLRLDAPPIPSDADPAYLALISRECNYV